MGPYLNPDLLWGLSCQINLWAGLVGYALWLGLFPLGLNIALQPRSGGRQWRAIVLPQLKGAVGAQIAAVGVFVIAGFLRSTPAKREVAAYLAVAAPSALSVLSITLCAWIRWCSMRAKSSGGTAPMARILPDVMLVTVALSIAALHVRVTSAGYRFTDNAEDLWPLLILEMLFALAAGRLFLALGRSANQYARVRALRFITLSLALAWFVAVMLFPYQPTKYPDHRVLGWGGLAQSLWRK